MFDGHVTVSVGAELTMVASTLTVTDVVLPCTCTRKVPWYVPGVSATVLKAIVSVPVFTPLVGETLNHDSRGLLRTTDHLSAPRPALLTRTVWDGALPPAFACELTEVALTESTVCAATVDDSGVATKNRRQSRPIRAARVRSVGTGCVSR